MHSEQVKQGCDLEKDGARLIGWERDRKSSLKWHWLRSEWEAMIDLEASVPGRAILKSKGSEERKRWPMWCEHSEQGGQCQEVRNQDLKQACRPWERFITGAVGNPGRSEFTFERDHFGCCVLMSRCQLRISSRQLKDINPEFKEEFHL